MFEEQDNYKIHKQMKRIMKFRAYYQKVTDDKFIIEGEYTMQDLTDRGILFDQERIKWVEFTGLLDKNGKEIYEGDIVKFISRGMDFLGAVIWPRDIEPIGEFSKKYEHMIYFPTYQENCEVIGNIYENANLIK